jgi:hypothetical protein
MATFFFLVRATSVLLSPPFFFFELDVTNYNAFFFRDLFPTPKASRLPRKILLVHGALTIVLPYIHTRLRGHALSKAWPDAPSSDRRRKAWELMTKLETTHAAIALVSFIAFLWDGQ